MMNGQYSVPMSRRRFLSQAGMGFGTLALASLLKGELDAKGTSPLSPREPHFAPRAKSIIFLYMDGSPSQVDTFDYKPMLEKAHGKNPRDVIGKLAPTQFDTIGSLMKSPFEFKRHGQSGI